jgi:hypothetical protein
MVREVGDDRSSTARKAAKPSGSSSSGAGGADGVAGEPTVGGAEVGLPTIGSGVAVLTGALGVVVGEGAFSSPPQAAGNRTAADRRKGAMRRRWSVMACQREFRTLGTNPSAETVILSAAKNLNQ